MPRQADVHDFLDACRRAEDSASALLERSREISQGEGARAVYVRCFDEDARATADAVDHLRGAGIVAGPLAGATVSIKDLFPVAGHPTTAASQVLPTTPSAADCPAVARLRRAGAVLTGHTNMTEFAFSGVGINPHHGTPMNAAMLALGHEPCIPGGSTSGGATSVALGAAMAALGSDTGGSLRIPAALQGLVGFKGTAGRVPTEGVLPLSPTLDTAGAITRSVRDAILMHEVLTGTPVKRHGRPLAGRVLLVADKIMQDGLDAAVAGAFERALSRLSAAGARVETVDLPLTDPVGWASLGSFPSAEAWHWHRELLEAHGECYDPRVASRIRRGASMSAADYLELQRRRRDWIGRMSVLLARGDAVVSPTVPIVAPALAPLLDDDERFFAVNAQLLRNPSAVNLLDGCATSLPCQEPGHAPVGLMLWGAALHDDTILDIALAVERALDRDLH